MLMRRCRKQPAAVVEQVGVAYECDDWWLVQARDADAAFKVIEHFEHNGEPCVHGRVLAHGGKR